MHEKERIKIVERLEEGCFSGVSIDCEGVGILVPRL